MASVLAQSIGMSGLLSGQRHGQHKGSGKSKRSLIMMSNLQMPALRMSSFSGLCTMNSLNLLSRSRRSFPFKMLTSISSRRERVPKAMFDRFTEKSTIVIMIAQAEARWMGQNFVGTGHILLGLIREGTGIAAKVMNSMGINLKDARVEVKKIIGRRSGSAALEIPFADGVLELSLEEARRLGHNYIETEHLLLGILQEGVGIAARVLENLGADPNKIRAQVIRMVGEVTGSNNNNKMPKYRRMTSMSSRPERVPTAMFARFTEKPTIVIILAQEEAKRLGHNFVGSEHILLGLIREGTGIAAKVMKSMGINLKDARVEVEKIIGRGSGFVALEIPFVQGVYELSLEEARQLGLNYIESEHLLLGILREGEGVAARVLENLGADPNNIRAQVIRMVGEGKMPTLEEYGTNLTKLAEEGKLDLVVGRQPQIERVTQILTRRYSKNNPCLIGEPGVGKTIAEGLAQRIANGDVPETIKGKKVITLDMGLLVAGTKHRGEFEERLKKLMEEIKRSNEIILFIDEVHTLIGAGAAEGAIHAANILKHALARGGLQCIGATTLDEYRKHIEKDPALQRRFRLVEVPASTVDKTIQIFQYTDNALVAAALLSHQYIRKHIEKDPALERRFQPVKVPEPTVDETIQILKGLRESYEIHHKVQYTDDALVAAAQLSHQYIGDPFLPDKAIDLIDEAGSRVRLQHAQLSTPMVTEVDILHIVSSWTGIPVEKVSTDESDGLLKMEETLHTRVIGEDEAVKAISRAIRSARVGLKNPNRPIASFIFYGATGVGKSELTKALAAYYFGSEEVMIRVDMSEFMERHTVFKLIGSPPGYVGYTEGGLLTEAVRRCPYSVVLFEEFEKAHPDVLNMILQILEDGRLTDSRGRTVDFKNTLLIIT